VAARRLPVKNPFRFSGCRDQQSEKKKRHENYSTNKELTESDFTILKMVSANNPAQDKTRILPVA